MKKLLQAVSAAGLLACGAAPSLATITMTASHGPGVVETDAINLGGNLWYVVINLKSDSIFPWVMIQGDNTNDVIMAIDVFNTSGGNTILNINVSDGAGGMASIGAIEELYVHTPATTWVGFTDLKFTGDFGTPTGANVFTTGRADWIDVGGDWRMNFKINDTSGTSHNQSFIIRGDLLGGSIYNNIGNLHQLSVGGDIAGTSLNPIEIWAKGNIGPIVADSISEVRIGSQTAGFTGYSTVTSITTRTGDFTSSFPMTMASLGNLNTDTAMNIYGDFDADITINNAMASSSTIYRIGGSLASTAVLSLPANGLLGNIIINANGGSGQFLGDIEVGATALSPNYATLSKDIGDGAAGKAPFNFHQFTGPLPGSRADLDCNPFHTEYIAVGACETVTDLDEAVIDHYGPVYAAGEGPHYRVEFLPAFFDPYTGPVWTDVTPQFEVDATRTATASASNNRKVYIVASKDNNNGFNAAGRFRFRPIDGKVKCANVAGNPDVAYNSSIVSGDLGNTSSGTQHHWYQFRVGLTVCPLGAPLFENDQVNASDLAAWIDEPFEVNMDGRICGQDFADMAAAYTPE